MLYPQPILLPVVNNGSIFKVYANSQLTKVANKTILATSLISQSWMSCCLSHHHHTISQHEGNGRLAHVGLYRCNIPTNPTSYGRRHFRLQSYSTNPLSRLFCAWLNILVLGCQFRLDLYAVYEAKKTTPPTLWYSLVGWHMYLVNNLCFLFLEREQSFPCGLGPCYIWDNVLPNTQTSHRNNPGR